MTLKERRRSRGGVLYDWDSLTARVDLANEIALKSAFLPEIAHFALKFSREPDPLAEMQRYCRENIRWREEPGERLAMADITLRYGVGDCDCSAIAFCALALALGFDARIVPMKMPGNLYHAVCQVLESTGWEFFDCSLWDILPRENPKAYLRRKKRREKQANHGAGVRRRSSIERV